VPRLSSSRSTDHRRGASTLFSGSFVEPEYCVDILSPPRNPGRRFGEGGGQRREKAWNYSLCFYAGSLARSALKAVRLKELEAKHREGYRRKPVKRGEFDWESEQVWAD